jgi:hypothetical protein
MRDYISQSDHFQFSSRDMVNSGNLALQISLMEGNPLSGGQVPKGLREKRVGQLTGLLGQIESYVRDAPNEDDRARREMDTMAQKTSLMSERQGEIVASLFGDKSRMIQMASNLNSDATLFSTSSGFPSLKDYQAGNRGGNVALGGTGENTSLNTSLNPFQEHVGGHSDTSPTLSHAIGYADQEGSILRMLERIARAVEGSRGSVSGGSGLGMATINEDRASPRAQVSAKANGNGIW